MKNYKELSNIKSYNDRFEYLKTSQKIGDLTFGRDRYLNQQFYTSDEWLKIRDRVITRDNGCDMGLDDHEINGIIIVHHIDPISSDDILNRSEKLLDLNNLISVSFKTHNAIHFSNDINSNILIERTAGDTKLW